MPKVYALFHKDGLWTLVTEQDLTTADSATLEGIDLKSFDSIKQIATLTGERAASLLVHIPDDWRDKQINELNSRYQGNARVMTAIELGLKLLPDWAVTVYYTAIQS
jgi:hypothetical protein